jgi:hypothetical protein
LVCYYQDAERVLLLLKTVLLSLIVAIVTLPANSAAQTEQPEPYQVAEAYEIYSAILPATWPVTEARARTLLIRAETGSGPDMCLKPEGESVSIVGPAIADFIEVNKKPWLLQKAFQINQPYEFIFDKELDGILAMASMAGRASMKSILIQAAIMNSRQLDLMRTRRSRSCTPLIPVVGFAVEANSMCSQRRKVSGKS